jgi:hypothetical protein
MRSIPAVVRAEYVSGYRLRITFHDGAVKIVDFSAWLNGPVFEPLRELEYFKRFMISGSTVSWPNGADIAPETLHSYSERPRSRQGATKKSSSKARAGAA